MLYNSNKESLLIETAHQNNCDLHWNSSFSSFNIVTNLNRLTTLFVICFRILLSTGQWEIVINDQEWTDWSCHTDCIKYAKRCMEIDIIIMFVRKCMKRVHWFQQADASCRTDKRDDIIWLPRSLDLTPPDFFLCGYLNLQMSLGIPLTSPRQTFSTKSPLCWCQKRYSLDSYIIKNIIKTDCKESS